MTPHGCDLTPLPGGNSLLGDRVSASLGKELLPASSSLPDRRDVDRELGIEYGRLLGVPKRVAEDPRRADPVVGPGMDVSVHPQVRLPVEDQARQVARVAVREVDARRQRQ